VAAESGDVAAQVNLAFMYMSGRGVEADYYHAIRWYEQAAIAGDDSAKAALTALASESFVVTQSDGRTPSPKTESVQKRLIALGFDPGAPDGTLSDQTRRAIDEFGQAVGEVYEGRPTLELLERLEESMLAGATRAQGGIIALDIAPPILKVPAEVRAIDSLVNFSGNVSDASELAEVRVNGRVLPVDHDGGIRIHRYVNRRVSSIFISAIDEWGNRSEREVRVLHRLAAPASLGDMDFGRYRAIVIGNNAYNDLPQLETAVNDAVAVGQMLATDYGFEVETLLNATRADVLDALERYREELQPSDDLLVYYAGHGWDDEEAKEGYWLPIDAHESGSSNWIANHTLTSIFRAMKAKHVLVVADSCFSGTLTRGLSIGTGNRDKVEQAVTSRARSALTSGGLEPVTDSGGGSHSIFAAEFLKALRRNESVLDAGSLFSEVRDGVVLEADQTPQYGDIGRARHEGGEFFFVRRTIAGTE